MAANVNVHLARYTLGPRRAHAVYLKANWAGAWVKVPWLFCDEAAWAVAPAVGAATLSWRFGRGMRQGELALGTINRLASFQTYFVKIECDSGASNNPLRWYGTVEIQTDVVLGLVGAANIPAGLTSIACVGLEQILRNFPVRTSVWRKEVGPGTYRVDRGYTFNQPNAVGVPAGNRHPEQFVFSSKIKDPDATWTTRKIAEYLCFIQKPKLDSGAELPLAIDNLTILPDWDLPVIEQQGKTLGQLLDETMPVGRGLTWWLAVDPDSNQMLVTPASLLGAVVTTPLGTLQPNPRRLAIEADGDATWAWHPTGSTLQQYDQVRVQGGQRTSTGTFGYLDGTWVDGWTDALEAEYEAAASGQAGYSGWDTYRKQTHNALVRGNDRLSSVYRRFVIAPSWAQTVADGNGTGTSRPFFPKFENNPSAEEANRYPVNPREIVILPATKFKDGHDYRNIGSATFRIEAPQVEEGPHNFLPPIVVFRDPVPTEAGGSTYRHYHVEKIAAAAKLETKSPAEERRWHGQVHVPEMDRALLLDVVGQPQHVLTTEFAALSVDEHVIPWDWKKAYFTVTVTDDRLCEGVYPADSSLPGTINRLVRELVIQAGDKYQQDWLVPNTVIGVDENGALVRCANGGWINDDRPKLEARARMAYEYYKFARRSIVLSGKDLLAATAIRLGDYVESISDRDPLAVGSIVSEIRVRFAEGPPGSVPSPEITFATAFADLDASLFGQ